MIGLLFNWRIWAAIAIAVALAASHWRAYKQGGKSVQAEWDAEKISLQQKALEAQESNRLKSIALGKETERIDRELQQSKKARSDAERIADGRLRNFTDAVNRSASDKARTAAGIDDARAERDILGSCAATAIGLAKEADRLEEKVNGLQGYVTAVCLK